MVLVAKGQRTDEDAAFRITAYQRVVASPVPWMRSHGLGGSPPSPGETPAASSCLPVAT